jgi:hypothetical protein
MGVPLLFTHAGQEASEIAIISDNFHGLILSIIEDKAWEGVIILEDLPPLGMRGAGNTNTA